MPHASPALIQRMENSLSCFSGAFNMLDYAGGLSDTPVKSMDLVSRVNDELAANKIIEMAFVKCHAGEPAYFLPVARAFGKMTHHALEQMEVMQLKPLNVALGEQPRLPPVPPSSIFGAIVWGCHFAMASGNSAPEVGTLQQNMQRLYKNHGDALSDKPPLENMLNSMSRQPMPRTGDTYYSSKAYIDQLSPHERNFLEHGFKGLRHGAIGYVDKAARVAKFDL